MGRKIRVYSLLKLHTIHSRSSPVTLSAFMDTGMAIASRTIIAVRRALLIFYGDTTSSSGNTLIGFVCEPLRKAWGMYAWQCMLR
jgi:hypothetical protein